MSLNNSMDSSYGWKGESQDMSLPSSSKETYKRLVRRRQVVPQIDQDENSWVGSTHVGLQRLVLKDEDDDDSGPVI